MSEEAAGTTTVESAGADSPELSQSAATGAEGSAEAETPESLSTEEEGAEGADTTTESADGAERKPSHKKTFEERIAEIEAKNERIIQERIEALTAAQKAEAEAQKAAQPDFIQVDMAAFDRHIAKLLVAEKQIHDELAFDPDNAADLVRQLRAVQNERLTLEQQYAANEQKRIAWQQKHQVAEREKAFHNAVQSDIDKIVNMLPQVRGVDPEALNAGRQFMTAEFKRDPLLQKRFDDIITHRATYHGLSGVSAAVDWAFSHAQENMGKAAEAARQKREEGKGKTPAGGDGAGSEFGSINSFSDLLKMPSAKINQFAKEHPTKFKNMKDRHFK